MYTRACVFRVFNIQVHVRGSARDASHIVDVQCHVTFQSYQTIW